MQQAAHAEAEPAQAFHSHHAFVADAARPCLCAVPGCGLAESAKVHYLTSAAPADTLKRLPKTYGSSQDGLDSVADAARPPLANGAATGPAEASPRPSAGRSSGWMQKAIDAASAVERVGELERELLDAGKKLEGYAIEYETLCRDAAEAARLLTLALNDDFNDCGKAGADAMALLLKLRKRGIASAIDAESAS